ncbi:Arm DNA-binding domain-containing protein [Novosphingobium beihaiensis]|uniref:Arm DNA-binding domain-containing protein n=1 Tax=Novosphingobium beihaiensis TaxID=2930389 RepID=A0ABT0BQ78_9SPHN|nr:Arm DNA-binding domain-containing protein [Novosphingobium beihaiensis]MCJ2187225.1 Arm DNA-binding domain-containing protein [Novosphingobium beihaiensis]
MALTDVTIRNAKPGPKPVKLADGGGMFLLVTPAGGKLWRLKYRIDGRENCWQSVPIPKLGSARRAVARRKREN